MLDEPKQDSRRIAEVCDRYLADPQFSETHHRDIAADPQQVWEAIRQSDPADSRVIRALFRARNLLGRIRRGHHRPDPYTGPPRGVPLADEAPLLLVRGMVGQWWTPAGSSLADVTTPEEFAVFAEPGNARAVFAHLLVEIPGGTRLITHTRVRCTDEAARRAMARYWLLIRPFSGLVRRMMLGQIAGRASEAAEA
jgi:hypothetical protein